MQGKIIVQSPERKTAKNITPAEDEVPTTNYNTHEKNNQKPVIEKFGTHRNRNNWANRKGLKRKYGQNA